MKSTNAKLLLSAFTVCASAITTLAQPSIRLLALRGEPQTPFDQQPYGRHFYITSTVGGVPQFSIKGGRFMRFDIQISTDLTSWSPIGTLTITNLNGRAEIADANAPPSDPRFYRAAGL